MGSRDLQNCPVCDRKFTSQSGLYKHKVKEHPDAGLLRKIEGRLCGICKKHVGNLRNLCLHLETEHHEKASVGTYEFESENEYLSWQRQKEKEGGVEFVRIMVDKQKNVLLVCHRSGDYTSKAHRRAPRDYGSIKIGFDCTAHISVKVLESGKYSVSACLDHYGHDIHAKYLHVSSESQSKIVQMVKSKQKTSDIALKLQLEGEGRERLIRAADVTNVVSRLGLHEFRKCDDDSTSVDMWVKEQNAYALSQGTESPFFAYNPMKDGNMDTFTLGIMTEFQVHILL